MNWVRNKAKKAINCGKEIKVVNRKGQERTITRDRKVGARCGDSCRKDCRNFNDDEQKNINQSFWQMGSWNLQRALLSAHVKVKSKERERKKYKDGSLDIKRRNCQITR